MNTPYPNVQTTLRRRALPLAILLSLMGVLTLLSACSPQTFPLKITGISASPEPVIGQVVTVHVEIKSTEDEPDTTIRVYLPRGVKLVGGTEPYGGEAVWQGSLTANQPQSFDVQVCVLYEGNWRIYVDTFSRLSPDSTYGDGETIHLISAANSGQAVPGWEYHYTYTPTEGPLIPSTPLPEIPPTGICP
jgi:hypothetical protein